jgi:hypothetical protein
VEATPQVQSSLALLPSQHMHQQSWATTQKIISKTTSGGVDSNLWV